MSKYFPPVRDAEEFHCPHCGVYAAQSWSSAGRAVFSTWVEAGPGYAFSYCTRCKKNAFWIGKALIHPMSAPVPDAHQAMPKDCKVDYEEAQSIVTQSPKAAAALIRLALQKLMVHLGEKGKNLNDDIGSLVAKGLDVHIQQALDYCRVVGNNGVHPGEIVLDDSPEIAHLLFEMINLIVEDRIDRPARVQQAYLKLPQGARDAIEQRKPK